MVSFCHSPAHQGGKELIPNTMGQTKQARGLASLSRATDTLSTLLAQQVRELNARQKAAKKEGASGAGTMKDLKEATAVLKDLAGVAKTLNGPPMVEIAAASETDGQQEVEVDGGTEDA